MPAPLIPPEAEGTVRRSVTFRSSWRGSYANLRVWSRARWNGNTPYSSGRFLFFFFTRRSRNLHAPGCRSRNHHHHRRRRRHHRHRRRRPHGCRPVRSALAALRTPMRQPRSLRNANRGREPHRCRARLQPPRTRPGAV